MTEPIPTLRLDQITLEDGRQITISRKGTYIKFSLGLENQLIQVETIGKLVMKPEDESDNVDLGEPDILAKKDNFMYKIILTSKYNNDEIYAIRDLQYKRADDIFKHVANILKIS